MKRDITPSATDTFERTIGGLLKRRQELLDESATLRDRMASITLDVQAVDRVLVSLGYSGTLEARPARPDRLQLFYRGELRRFIIDALREAGKPLTTRDMALKLLKIEEGQGYDRKLFAEVTGRCSKAVRQMRDQGLLVEAGQGPGTSFLWALASDQNP